MFATEPHFASHLAPVWRALQADARGTFVVPRSILPWTARYGVPEATPEYQDLSRPVLVASYGDEKKARLMGRTAIAFIEHGIGQSYAGSPADQRAATHASYAGGRDRDDVGLFLVPNASCAARWRAAYPARVEVIGCPKLDGLPAHTGPAGVVAISFHWEAMLCPETRSAASHYGPALLELARRFPMIGHGHPRAMDGQPRLSRAYLRAGIEIVEDFQEVCRRASVFVCDNSSALFEFAATGRPVVVLNAPSYRRQIEHGLRFWEAANVGIQVNEPGDLANAIERALVDEPEQYANREAALGLVYAYRSGAAQRAAEALLAWAAETAEVAA